MSMATSLMDFILHLLGDNEAKAAFVANPEKALADAGLEGVCSQDVADAMSYVAEYHPVSFVGNREYNVGNTNGSQHGSSYHPDPHASAAQQLEYVTNNYSYTDNHDTVIDKSVNQSIWNEGELNQRFDDHSVTATDHSVAAGRDIDGNVANGDDNVVGEDNNVGNTDNSVNDSFNGNNLADNGSVAGTNNDGNVTNPDDSHVATTDGEVDESKNDSHDTTIRDSFNDSHYSDSHNYDSHDSDSHVSDSHDSDSHVSDSHDSDSHDSDSHDSDSHDSDSHVSDSHDYLSHNQESAITETHQEGLINANVSPAVNLPVHDNTLDVLHLG